MIIAKSLKRQAASVLGTVLSMALRCRWCTKSPGNEKEIEAQHKPERLLRSPIVIIFTFSSIALTLLGTISVSWRTCGSWSNWFQTVLNCRTRLKRKLIAFWSYIIEAAAVVFKFNLTKRPSKKLVKTTVTLCWSQTKRWIASKRLKTTVWERKSRKPSRCTRIDSTALALECGSLTVCAGGCSCNL